MNQAKQGEAVEDEEEAVPSDEEVVPALLDLPEERGLAALIPPEAVSDLWKRCVVTHNGGHGVKIYFDNASDGQSGLQRGWSHCPLHQCRRYRLCQSYASRQHFAAEQYLWWMAKDEPECDSHDNHLGYTPSHSDVLRLTSEITLRDF